MCFILCNICMFVDCFEWYFITWMCPLCCDESMCVCEVHIAKREDNEGGRYIMLGSVWDSYILCPVDNVSYLITYFPLSSSTLWRLPNGLSCFKRTVCEKSIIAWICKQKNNFATTQLWVHKPNNYYVKKHIMPRTLFIATTCYVLEDQRSSPNPAGGNFWKVYSL